MNTSLLHRIDNRTVDQFANDVDKFTKLEKVYGLALVEDIRERFGVDVSVFDSGVDNSGKLIRDELNFHSVDKVFYAAGVFYLVEIKTAPDHLRSFYTFKVFSLWQVLIQFGVVVVVQSFGYLVFRELAINWMLSNLDHRIYPQFSPNDISVRISQDSLNMMICTGRVVKRDWMTSARKIILRELMK